MHSYRSYKMGVAFHVQGAGYPNAPRTLLYFHINVKGQTVTCCNASPKLYGCFGLHYLLAAFVLKAKDEMAFLGNLRTLQFTLRKECGTDVMVTPPVQVEAERKKRATVLESEGTRESAINVAEGRKRAQILASEGEKAEQINKAAGAVTAACSQCEIQ